MIESSDDRRSIDIFAEGGRAGRRRLTTAWSRQSAARKKLGRYVVLQDVYGNRYTYAHLGEVSKYYPVPKNDADGGLVRTAKAVHANGEVSADPRPRLPASAGRQLDDSDRAPERNRGGDIESHDATQASAPVKQRLFAHPDLPGAREAGGLEQQLEALAREGGKFETYKNFFSRPFGLDPEQGRAACLQEGLARDRRHDHRSRRPDRPWQGLPSRLLDPAGRARARR